VRAVVSPRGSWCRRVNDQAISRAGRNFALETQWIMFCLSAEKSAPSGPVREVFNTVRIRSSVGTGGRAANGLALPRGAPEEGILGNPQPILSPRQLAHRIAKLGTSLDALPRFRQYHASSFYSGFMVSVAKLARIAIAPGLEHLRVPLQRMGNCSHTSPTRQAEQSPSS
jgi:hypothetical protein